jgi:hypothetical protein
MPRQPSVVDKHVGARLRARLFDRPVQFFFDGLRRGK